MTLFRHIAARVWISLLFWVLIALWFLPILQRITGFTWRLLPVIMLLVGIFMVTGLIMERIAHTRIEHHLADASVWERAGMLKEAESALNAAVAMFDSFLLSPKGREPYQEKLLVRAARQRLRRSRENIASDKWVLAYLNRFPK
ncbi:MAG: hypothetical protein PVI90_11010, partial [Desulfobacteraceae bacterium]